MVIPAYNAEETILQTVRSVQRQALEDLEILVVDDGSDDHTLEELERVDDPRLQVCGASHRGVAAARGLGLEQSSGEFISFLDSDDLWTRDKLELQVAALDADPRLAVAYSWTVFVDERGRFVFAKEPARFEGDVYAELATSNFLASASNALARTERLDEVGGFDESFGPAADWEYWLRVAARARFAVVPRYQVLYRLRGGSMSTDVDRMASGMRAVHDSVFERSPPALARRREEALSNLAQYTSFLHLMRTSSPRARERARVVLRESLAVHPRAFWTWKLQFLLWTLLVTLPLPRRSAPGAARALLSLYGRLIRMAKPELHGVTET